jgi:hypothetical protein
MQVDNEKVVTEGVQAGIPSSGRPVVIRQASDDLVGSTGQHT